MAGPAWLVDSKRIATKIKRASTACSPDGIKWKSNPSRACPNCQHRIDNSDVHQEWPGLPRGVKFDPSDQEIIWHLLTKDQLEAEANMDLPNQEPVNEETALDGMADYSDFNNAGEGQKWWDSESQNLLDSQQLVQGLSRCDDLLRSQSPDRDFAVSDPQKRCLSDCATLGPEDLKRDLEECQKLVLDPANLELDTPPEFRLSHLEFGSQDSFLAWGGNKLAD